jgi:hypothetical protein
MSNGIDGLLIETHNWGATVAFWQDLGYRLEFETDHHSGQLRHPGGGPYLFVAERPASDPIVVQLMVGVDDADAFTAPAAGTLARGWEPQHWGVTEAVVDDPDGRPISVQAPVPARD